MIAGHYFDQGTSYILLYSQHPDVCVDFPPKLREEALHVAQASYAISGRKGISVYSFPSSKVSELEKITFTREVYLDKTPKTNPTELANILQTYGIQTEVLCDGWETILDIIARDVKVHAGRKRPKQEHENWVKIVGKIVPNTKEGTWGEVSISDLGKQDYLDTCLIDLNVDFFANSCSSLMRNGYYSPFSRCDYCYARGNHKDVPLKMIKRANKKRLIAEIEQKREERTSQGKRTQYLRFGKTSEPGSKMTREALLTTLEVCLETNLSPIFPTKFLEFDPNVVELLKKTNTALLYSIGADSLEEGPVNAGCTNQFRMEQAQLYRENGVNTGLYLLTEGTNFANPIFHKNLQEALLLHKKTGMPLQLLPIRPSGKKQLELITGRSARELLVKGQGNLLTNQFSSGGYIKLPNNQYLATELDSRFLELGLPMCHHNPEYTWCGGCLHEEAKKVETIEEDPKNARKRKLERKKNRQRRAKPLTLFKE